MDAIFRALADPTRRRLLDLLRQRDGQTLTELEAQVDLGRFGVMKHLKVLADASLVTTRKRGRFTHHYLNPVPIREVADRWISAYAAPQARSVTDLKTRLEAEAMTAAETRPHDLVLVTYIKAPLARVWAALTDPEETRQYYFGTAVESRWDVGAPVKYLHPDGSVMLDGEILEIDPPHRLVTSFDPLWAGDGFRQDIPSRVTYELTEESGVTKLTLIHDRITNPRQHEGVSGGWPKILSGLKTLAETGECLMPPAEAV